MYMYNIDFASKCIQHDLRKMFIALVVRQLLTSLIVELRYNVHVITLTIMVKFY